MDQTVLTVADYISPLHFDGNKLRDTEKVGAFWRIVRGQKSLFLVLALIPRQREAAN